MADFLTRFRIDLLLLIVAASWGSTYLVAKEVVSADSVLSFLAVRMALAAAIMTALLAARGRRITANEFGVGVTLGLVLAAVFVAETYGVANTSATNAGLIISLAIVFTPALDSLVYRRWLPRRFFLAGLIAIAGVALLAMGEGLRPPALGDLLILVAAVFRAVHVTMMSRRGKGRPWDSLHVTTAQLATCAVIFTLASLTTGHSIPDFVATLNTTRTGLLLYLVLICTVFAFLVQTWAVRRTSPARVSMLLGTEPIWAAIIGIVIAGDEPTVGGYLGIALIIMGTAWGRSIEHHHSAASEPTSRPTPLLQHDRPGS